MLTFRVSESISIYFIKASKLLMTHSQKQPKREASALQLTNLNFQTLLATEVCFYSRGKQLLN